MVDLYNEFDFSKELIAEEKELKGADLEAFKKLLKNAVQQFSEEKASDLPQKPVLDDKCQNFIIVSGMPITDMEKRDKLGSAFINTVIQGLQLEDTYKQMEIGMDDTGKKTNGCIVIEFNSVDLAESAKTKIHGLKFFKDTLYAFNLQEYDYFTRLSEQINPVVFRSRKVLNSWLSDPMRRDQFILRTANEGVLNWFFHIQKNPVPQGSRVRFQPGSRLEFSKTGAYLAQLTSTGFRLFGGPGLEFLAFFQHPAVQQIQFSPNDQYVLSFNGTNVEAPDQQNYIVWNVESRSKIKVFHAKQEETWGTIKWSQDNRYFSRTSQGLVSVYDLPSGALNDDRSLIVPGVQRCHWVEQSNILICAIYAGHLKDKDQKIISTKFQLYQFPDRVEYQWKSSNFQSSEVDIFSQETGQWVCTCIKKNQKKRQIFHVHLAVPKKNSTFEVSDQEFQQKIYNYSCETKHGRLGLSFKDESRNHSYQIVLISFEEDSTKSLAMNEAMKYEDKRTNQVVWSRNGIFFALVNQEVGTPYCGKIQFGFLFKTKDKRYSAEIIFETEVPYMSFCQWDPSGRLFLAYSAQTKTYEIWTPIGERLWKDTISGGELESLFWRPRPLNVLDEKEDADVVAQLNDYRKKYEQEDDKIINQLQYEKEEKRNKLKTDFEQLLKQNRQIWSESKGERIKLRGFDIQSTTNWEIDEIIESEQVLEKVIVPQNAQR